MLTYQPIEQCRPATVVKAGVSPRTRLSPDIFEKIEALQDPEITKLVVGFDTTSVMRTLYAELAQRFAAGEQCIEVTVGDRPTWRFYADGRCEDLPWTYNGFPTLR